VSVEVVCPTHGRAGKVKAFDVFGRQLQRSVGQRAGISDQQTAWDLIQRSCDIAEDVGAFLFGFNQWPDPATFHPQRPFRMTGYVGGHAMGIRRGSKLWFPLEGMHGSEDMWVSALNAYHHRRVFVDMRYHLGQGGTFKNVGGLAGQRTMADFRTNFEVLRETFGGAIAQKKATGRAKLSHEYQIELRIPW
jgi:hypothetical protein